MTVLCVMTLEKEDGKKKEQTCFVELETNSLAEANKQKCLGILNNWLDSVFSSDISGQIDTAKCTFELIDID